MLSKVSSSAARPPRVTGRAFASRRLAGRSWRALLEGTPENDIPFAPAFVAIVAASRFPSPIRPLRAAAAAHAAAKVNGLGDPDPPWRQHARLGNARRSQNVFSYDLPLAA